MVWEYLHRINKAHKKCFHFFLVGGPHSSAHPVAAQLHTLHVNVLSCFMHTHCVDVWHTPALSLCVCGFVESIKKKKKLECSTHVSPHRHGKHIDKLSRWNVNTCKPTEPRRILCCSFVPMWNTKTITGGMDCGTPIGPKWNNIQWMWNEWER